jgi:hypothetical protein
VLYNCKNLREYEAVYNRASAADKDKICTEPIIAFKYGFIGIDYIAGLGLSAGHNCFYTLPISARTAYDLRSIMHYKTDTNSIDGCSQTRLDLCPLASYRDPKKPYKGINFIPGTTRPSPQDIAAIKIFYPWQDPPPPGSADIEDSVSTPIRSCTPPGSQTPAWPPLPTNSFQGKI